MMDLTQIFMIAAGVSAALYATSMVYTVKQKTEALITSFGKHTKTDDKPGIKLKKPWPFAVVETRIGTDLRQVEETLATKTKDNLFVNLPIAIQYRVNDTAKYYFDNNSPVENMAKVVSAAVRKYTSGKDFQELYDERDEISKGVIKEVAEQVARYGIEVEQIIVDEPSAPEDVQNAYNRVRASEREKDAAKNEADADYIRAVRKAEGKREADILSGEGVAGFRQKIADGYADQRQKLIDGGVSPAAADHFMLEAMRLDTHRDIGSQGNMVLVVPAEGSGPGNSLTEIIKAQPVANKISNGGPAPTPGG